MSKAREKLCNMCCLKLQESFPEPLRSQRFRQCENCRTWPFLPQALGLELARWQCP
jgi:hypothetical protein